MSTNPDTALVKEQTPQVSLSRSAMIIAIFTLLSRVLGFILALVLAAKFGAGVELDAYNAAFRVPDLLFNIFIIGTLSVALLPVYNRELIKDKENAARLANSVLTIALAGIALLALILFIFAPLLVHLIAPGFNGHAKDLTVMLTRIMLLAPMLFTVGNIVAVVLQSHDRFFATSFAPLLYNIGIIFGALVLTKFFGLAGLGLGVILGALLHTLIQVGDLKNIKYKLALVWDTKLKAVKTVGKLYVPRLLSFDNTQITLLISSIIGSLLATGSITIFTFASNLQAVPVGIFALSFAVAIFPGLSKAWADEKPEYFKKLISRTIVQILFFIIPLSVVMIILRWQITRVALGHGKFGWQETLTTAQTFGALAISLFAQSVIPLLARAFYATYNTIIPVVISITTGILNVLLAVVLSKHYGVVGLGLAASIASITGVLLFLAMLRQRIGKIGGLYIAENVLKISIAATFGAIACYTTSFALSPFVNLRSTIGVLIQGGLAGVAGLLIYLILGLLLNLREARALVSTTRLWLFRLSRALPFINIPWDR